MLELVFMVGGMFVSFGLAIGIILLTIDRIINGGM